MQTRSRALQTGPSTESFGLVEPVLELARQAGAVILEHYRPDVAAEIKPDGSPVTVADRAAEAIILAGLAALTPEVPVIAEEAFAGAATPPPAPPRFWLVDPLDGTKEFVRHDEHFTVNIGLVHDRRPVLGVVHAPALGATYWTPAPGRAVVAEDGAAPRAIAARRAPAEGLTVVASRTHGKGPIFESYLARHRVAARLTMGSSIKLCLIARGAADLYPRFGPTMEWDTAAAHAVLAAAGGHVETEDGEPLAYGKPGFRNPFFIARGRD